MPTKEQIDKWDKRSIAVGIIGVIAIILAEVFIR